MCEKEPFVILKNFRKKKIVKHRERKTFPPIAVETRRMTQTRSLDLQEREFLNEDVKEESVSAVQEFSLHNFIEDELLMKLEEYHDTESTPFGIHSGEMHSVNQFLILNEL